MTNAMPNLSSRYFGKYAAMRLEHLPESRVFLSYGFTDVNTGIEAARLIMTKRWKPAVIRLYDEADTKKLSEFLNLGVQGVLMVIMCDGTKSLTDLEAKEIDLICTGVGGKPHGPQVGQNWWDGKYEPFKHGNIPAPPMIYGTTDTCARFNDLPAPVSPVSTLKPCERFKSSSRTMTKSRKLMCRKAMAYTPPSFQCIFLRKVSK